MKKPRATIAGEKQAEAIIETVHLMYQNKTALKYLLALRKVINEEILRRCKDS